MVQMMIFFPWLFLMMSCSADSNFNQVWSSKGQKEALDVLLADAERAYDQEDYEEALKLANKAYAVNSTSEEVAVMLGYIYLSKGGIDTFQLADKMIDMTEKKTTTTSSGNAASALDTLSDVLGISEADQLQLGDISAGKSALEYFKKYDIIIPKKASEARAAGVSTVENVSNAIMSICPFVSNKVKVSGDSRHASADCTPAEVTGKLSAKAHFLWAIGHLTEALGFYPILLYQSTGSTKPNLELRIETLNTNASKVSLLDYVNYVKELVAITDKLFPSGDADSMLTAVLNDFEAAVAGFGQLAGIPESITDSITKGLNTIKDEQKKVTTASSSAGSTEMGAAALKSQLTSNVSTALAKQIASYKTSNPSGFAQQKTDLCSAYAQMTAGTKGTLTDCQ